MSLKANGTRDKPKWWSTMRRPASTPDRLIVDLDLNYNCCSGPSIVPDEWVLSLPKEMASRGVSLEEWLFLMKSIKERGENGIE